MTGKADRALTVRPIRYTTRADEVTALLQAIGMRLDVDHGAWRVLSCGVGRVAVHAMPEDDPLAGTTVLGLELAGASGPDDLDALAAALAAKGVAAHRFEADHGPSLRVDAGERSFLVDLPNPVPDGPVPDPDLAILTLLYTHDAPALARLLEAVGLRRRIEADSQTWIDLAAPGAVGEAGVAASAGFVGVHAEATAEHADHAAAELHLEYRGSLEVVAQRLAERGIRATLVDESWGHSLRIPDPDGGEIYLNAEQTDLYGYRRVE